MRNNHGQEEYDNEITVNLFSGNEAKGLCEVERDFLESYAESKDKMSLEEWLPQKLGKELPTKSPEEIRLVSAEIIDSLKVTEDMNRALRGAVSKGRSKESWLASTLEESTSQMTVAERVKYLQRLDDAVTNANVEMLKTITTKSSRYVVPSMNPNLDGFIAEQHHVNSFNMEAAAKGSKLRAEVQPLKPGETYSKNGFDVTIKDEYGNRVHQYQMKYGATAEDTIKLLKEGNYNNQTIVVPEDQVKEVQKAFPNKTVTSTIGEGNVKSKPLTKEQAKEMQKKAQSGNFLETDWNEYSTKDLAIGIGKEVGLATLQGAVISTSIAVASDVIKGKPIKGEKVVETAIVSGADFGVKAALAGALKTATEKEIIDIIPNGTPAAMYANIAFVAVEDLKVVYKVATGELSVDEGVDEFRITTVSCVAGIAASLEGAEIGAAVGTLLGPAGTVVGGIIGGGVGYMVGSKFGEVATRGYHKVRDYAKEKIRDGYKKAKETCKRVSSTIKSKAKKAWRKIKEFI